MAQPPTTISTLVQMLKRCGDAKDLAAGRRLHAHIKQNIPLPSQTVFLQNWILKMYGDCGSVEDARAVFDSLPSPNAHSWNILIKGYAKNGRRAEALACLEQMWSCGMRANHVTLVSALDACDGKRDLAKVQEIHADIESGSYGGLIGVANALIRVYARCGGFDQAESVFLKMPRRDLISWNTMMRAFTLGGRSKETLVLFERMQDEGFKPDTVSFVCAIDACTKLDTLEKGRAIHATIIDSGFENHVIVGTALVNMYGKCGMLEDARSLFSRMPERNKISWSAMISACSQNGCPEKALGLFNEMQCKGIKPDHVTFICALDACAILADLEQGHEVHAAIIREGYEGHVAVANALINMYGKSRSLEHARKAFQQMPYRDVISWNALITACSQNENPRLALDYYHQMLCEGFRPDPVTFASALEACASLEALEVGKRIHRAIHHAGGEGDAILGTALVSMYGKCHLLEDARNAFDRITHPDVQSWSAIMTACMQNGKAKESLSLFDKMQHCGFKPDQFAFVCALDACASLALLEKGRKIHAAIREAHCQRNVVVATALVNMYGKCGSLDDARQIFDHVTDRTLVLWNAMIAAYAHNGCSIEAIELFKQMQRYGFIPDQATFISVLAACSHAGNVDEARLVVKSMTERYGLTPEAEHHRCLIDVLGRAGCLKGVEDMIDCVSNENKTRM